MTSTAAFHARVRGSVLGLGGLKETKMFLPHPRVKVSIVGSLRDQEVACSASDRQGSYFESCVWRTVSSQSSHHPQEVLLAQFSLYVHKGGLKPDSFHFFFGTCLLHPHFNSYWQALGASGRVDQHGVHVLSLVALFQPHKLDGSSGLESRHCPKIMASLINSPFQVLFEGMECRWNIIHIPVSSEQMKCSFIHLTENRCSLVQ